ncbi:hypothetical protein ACX122_01555 [Kosakonia cowanii]
MNDTWTNLQPLRIASGWCIDFNNFYAFEPNAENMRWFYGSILISGHNQKGLCFDSRYEPEGDPDGAFVLDFIQLPQDGKAEIFLGTTKTRSKSDFITQIETFMFTEKAPA